MLQQWKQAVDNSQAFEAQVADLSKALGCLPQELLIPKLNAYVVGQKALKLMHN